jgi:hypothetical protein
MKGRSFGEATLMLARERAQRSKRSRKRSLFADRYSRIAVDRNLCDELADAVSFLFPLLASSGP